MTSTNGDQPPRQRVSVPWFGARKMARQLAVELQELRAQYDTGREQLERFSVLGRELVAEIKGLRDERDVMREQLEALGALPIVQLELRRRELEREIAEQASRLDREKSEASAALESMKSQLKKAHEGIVATDDLALLQEVGIYPHIYT